jgi:hypothetical protein
MDSASVEVFRLQNMKSTEPNWPLILHKKYVEVLESTVPYSRFVAPIVKRLKSSPGPQSHGGIFERHFIWFGIESVHVFL